jgi:hypothetical protein
MAGRFLTRWLSNRMLSPGRRLATLFPFPALRLGLLKKSLAISFLLSTFAIFDLIRSDQCFGRFAENAFVLAKFTDPVVCCIAGICSSTFCGDLTAAPSSPIKRPIKTTLAIPTRTPGASTSSNGRTIMVSSTARWQRTRATLGRHAVLIRVARPLNGARNLRFTGKGELGRSWGAFCHSRMLLE